MAYSGFCKGGEGETADLRARGAHPLPNMVMLGEGVINLSPKGGGAVALPPPLNTPLASQRQQVAFFIPFTSRITANYHGFIALSRVKIAAVILTLVVLPFLFTLFSL